MRDGTPVERNSFDELRGKILLSLSKRGYERAEVTGLPTHLLNLDSVAWFQMEVV